MTQLPTLTAFAAAVPDKLTMSKDVFANSVYVYLEYFNTSFTPEMIAHRTAMNTLSTEVQTASDSAGASALIAQTSTKYQGDWSLTPTLPVVYPYPLGVSVSHNGFKWASKVNNNTEEPVAESANWALLALNTALNLTTVGSITEQESVWSTLALTPTLGTIQTKTMTADETWTDSLTAGQSMTLLLTHGGWTPTYPTITWIGKTGIAPTLNVTDLIVFFKIGTTLYGAHAGKVA